MYNWIEITGEWPDGNPYNVQPNVAVEIFNIIRSQINRIQEQEIRASKNRA